KHSLLVEYLIEELLGLEQHILTPEPKVDDEFYVAKLIIILNACQSNPHIISQLPEYTHKHYEYLKDKFTDLFPELMLKTIGPLTYATRIQEQQLGEEENPQEYLQ